MMDWNLKNGNKMEIKLSVLILTHNRPKLFKRCIDSIYLNKPDWCEIIVNNDSADIEEVYDARYYYYKNNDLSMIYKFLFDKARGEYIYILEDDDYVVNDFFKKIKLTNSIYKYMPDQGIKEFLRKDFQLDFKEYFQLGQMIFRKKDIISFPTGNDIHNDYKLYQNILNWKYFDTIIYYQSTDGKDNISYEHLNKDIRFKKEI